MAEPTRQEIASYIAKVSFQGDTKGFDQAAKSVSTFTKKLGALKTASSGVEKVFGSLTKVFNKVGAIAGTGFGLQKSFSFSVTYISIQNK